MKKFFESIDNQLHETDYSGKKRIRDRIKIDIVVYQNSCTINQITQYVKGSMSEVIKIGTPLEQVPEEQVEVFRLLNAFAFLIKSGIPLSVNTVNTLTLSSIIHNQGENNITLEDMIDKILEQIWIADHTRPLYREDNMYHTLDELVKLSYDLTRQRKIDSY